MKNDAYREAEARIETEDTATKESDRRVEDLVNGLDAHEVVIVLDALAKRCPELMHKALVKRENALIKAVEKINALTEDLKA